MAKSKDYSDSPYFEKIVKNNKPKGRQDQKRKKENHRKSSNK